MAERSSLQQQRRKRSVLSRFRERLNKWTHGSFLLAIVLFADVFQRVEDPRYADASSPSVSLVVDGSEDHSLASLVQPDGVGGVSVDNESFARDTELFA